MSQTVGSRLFRKLPYQTTHRHVQQVLAASWESAACHDNFFKMMRDCKSAAKFGNYCHSFLSAFHEADAFQSVDRLPDALKDILTRYVKVLQCVIVLLEPAGSWPLEALADVALLAQHTGSEVLEGTASVLLQEHDQWKPLFEDFLKTAAASKELLPTVRELQSLLKDNEDLPEMDDAVCKAGSMLGQWKQKLRRGACDHLEQLLAKRVLLIGRNITSSDSIKGLDSAKLDSYQQCLSALSQIQGVADMKQRFLEWRSGLVLHIRKQDILDFTADNHDLDKDIRLDLQRFAGLFNQLDGLVFEIDEVDLLTGLCFNVFRQMKHKARPARIPIFDHVLHFT